MGLIPIRVQDEQNQKDTKAVTSDLVTKLIVPALSLVASIVALIKDQPKVALALLAILVLSIGVSFYSSLRASVREKLSHRGDARVLQQSLPDFARFLSRFGEFVHFPSAGGQSIQDVTLSALCNQNMSDFDRLHMLPVDFFKGYCYHLSQRTGGRRLTCEALPEAISELNMLVSDYIRYCIDPVFERFPPDMRPLLTERAKRELNSFRERFVRFLDDYSEYLKKLEASLREPRIQGYYLPRPKPL